MTKSNIIIKDDNCEWPDGYPERLKRISWKIETTQGIIAGPYKYYNRHLPYNTKGDSCFVKNVLYDYFKQFGKNPEQFKELIDYTLEYISIYYSENNCEFNIRAKQSKDKKFDIAKFHELTRL